MTKWLIAFSTFFFLTGCFENETSKVGSDSTAQIRQNTREIATESNNSNSGPSQQKEQPGIEIKNEASNKEIPNPLVQNQKSIEKQGNTAEVKPEKNTSKALKEIKTNVAKKEKTATNINAKKSTPLNTKQKEKRSKLVTSEYNKVQRKENSASNFSMEELRVGSQRPQTQEEIKYQKSQCRYAFMTEQEIIANNCSVKTVKFR